MDPEEADARGHVWVSPPPGSGSSRNPICKKCGARKSVANLTPDDNCEGASRDVVIETTHDYDPLP